MTVPEPYINAIESRLAATSGSSWELTRDGTGAASIAVRLADGRKRRLAVRREAESASDGDVEFVAHARNDLTRLIAAVRGQSPLPDAERAAIAARVDRASAGPWKAFLRSSGGLGGDSVIWVSDSDDEPDMYLWLDNAPATDDDYAFVAAARTDIVELLQAVAGGPDG
jgi:hypothetical protein